MPGRLLRVTAAGLIAAVLLWGLAHGSYEPNAQWIMPLALVGFGAAVGHWWVLGVALVPVISALPQGVSGDPPAVPAAIYLALFIGALLALGVGTSKLVRALRA